MNTITYREDRPKENNIIFCQKRGKPPLFKLKMLTKFLPLLAPSILAVPHWDGGHTSHGGGQLYQKETNKLANAQLENHEIVEDIDFFDEQVYNFFHSYAFQRKYGHHLNDEDQAQLDYLRAEGKKVSSKILKKYKALAAKIAEFEGYVYDIADILGDDFKQQFGIFGDPCADSPCQNGAICYAAEHPEVWQEDHCLYICDCPVGFEGQHCEIDIDECAPEPCLNGSECIDGAGEFTCNCLPGYEGQFCETDINECFFIQCVNGECIDGINQATCDCDAGWTGDLCDININECNPDPCYNGAICIDGIAEFECVCQPGWKGTRCGEPTIYSKTISKYSPWYREDFDGNYQTCDGFWPTYGDEFIGGNDFTFEFEVKASNDAHVSFCADPFSCIEFVIGEQNEYSVFKSSQIYGYEDNPLIERFYTPGILYDHEYRAFKFEFINGNIRIYKATNQEAINRQPGDTWRRLAVSNKIN